ncbi:MAG: cytochrome c oxidase subunit II, partial [Gammaproteobacteria bacterium]|nr:cytochrome c oxidase subunit II [Gammaproteobacteria bacterium]
MAVALVILLVVIGSVIFHYLNPWAFLPIASQWQFIDVTVYITFWICGVAFVILGAFMAWAINKYKYREGRFSRYEPENAPLEKWLTGITTIGVVVMLAPGLIVWDDYINVPADAMEVEVQGEQWTWKFRLPGEDGIFGTVSTENIDSLNPFGINEGDPHGEDDILITTNTLHLPVDRNVKMLLRSKDVLHDFWVPRIRAKMDMVPGMVTYFWFRPTEVGELDILCAELCGKSHFNMRGTLYLDTEEDYRNWLSNQVTYAEMKAGRKPEEPIVAEGRMVADKNGCFACHSLDGSATVGPTWLDMWGRSVEMTDGTQVVIDEQYVRESIVDP